MNSWPVRATWISGVLLAAVYFATMAPGVTFWDAGEFIAAASSFGIPHPPGTPLFVALGRAWIVVAGSTLGAARAMNVISVLATSTAGGLTAWLVTRGNGAVGAPYGGIAGALCAGLMTSVWANATETEVYAISLVHVVVMLACAARSSPGNGAHEDRWLLLTAYLIALAPALHLSALVGAPAAIVLASRTPEGRWRIDRLALLGGVLVAAAGAGRMSWWLATLGAVISFAPVLVRGKRKEAGITVIVLAAIASSALLILLVRARHDPAINQGNPDTFAALVDVVARHQYDVAPLWPRQAPAWIQLATLAEYVDWQFAMSWGDGVFTTPARIGTTIVFVVLAIAGWRAMRRDARVTAEALATLVVCGTLGVCVYLNLKAGWSIGYGFVPHDAHEARERDYFFVLGFWGWGIFAGYGAVAIARVRKWPPTLAAAVALVPLAGNWTVNDRARGPEATAAHDVAVAFLASAPRHAVMFVSGDNDTYPLWYLQQTEGIRRDVSVVTIPLLPAGWYGEEIARRSGWRWNNADRIPGAQWQHEELAARIASAARAAGRPVAASVLVPASTRNLLGAAWQLRGLLYISHGPRSAISTSPTFDTTFVIPSGWSMSLSGRLRQPDDVAPMMMSLLECHRITALTATQRASRDSLESRCNFR
ncbi:MAG: hypothetical protein JWM95_3864 [Gemmatimonadetes bacterium]|nr:hypothetical protein [Gemmatimonadota bacterium]